MRSFSNPSYSLSSITSPSSPPAVNKAPSRRRFHGYAELGVGESPVLEAAQEPPLRRGLYLSQDPSSPDSGVETLPASNYSLVSELPVGWERHEDEHGHYFWHVPSGTIQRELPRASEKPTRPKSFCSEPSTPSASSPSFPTSEKETSPELDLDEECLRFSLRSLGWQYMDPDEVNSDRSSKAVNRCIHSLTTARAQSEAAGAWGEGQPVVLQLDKQRLSIRDGISDQQLHNQPILAIKLWGVGRDNPRDFAFVAREDGKYICHVFRSEGVAAKKIANALCHRCKQLMLEREKHRESRKSSLNQQEVAARPHDLPGLFPTPQEEPSKCIPCMYLGSIAVKQPTGVTVLNNAVDELVESGATPVPVNVLVAPSSVSIVHGDTEDLLAETRVRFLSFLGVSRRSPKLVGFIFHSATGFMCHVCHCEPNAGGLCRTVEAACNLRFQKCLDARPEKSQASPSSVGSTPSSKRSMLSLSSVLKSFGWDKTQHPQSVHS